MLQVLADPARRRTEIGRNQRQRHVPRPTLMSMSVSARPASPLSLPGRQLTTRANSDDLRASISDASGSEDARAACMIAPSRSAAHCFEPGTACAYIVMVTAGVAYPRYSATVGTVQRCAHGPGIQSRNVAARRRPRTSRAVARSSATRNGTDACGRPWTLFRGLLSRRLWVRVPSGVPRAAQMRAISWAVVALAGFARRGAASPACFAPCRWSA